MVTWACVDEAAPAARFRVRRVLAERLVMRVEEIAERTLLDRDAVRAALHGLVDEGFVRRLRPVGYERTDHDFFRLVGAEDSRYEWEQRILNVGRFREPAEPAGRRRPRLAWTV